MITLKRKPVLFEIDVVAERTVTLHALQIFEFTSSQVGLLNKAIFIHLSIPSGMLRYDLLIGVIGFEHFGTTVLISLVKSGRLSLLNSLVTDPLLQLMNLLVRVLLHLVLHAFEDSLHQLGSLCLANACFLLPFNCICIMHAFQKLIIGTNLIGFSQLRNTMLSLASL